MLDSIETAHCAELSQIIKEDFKDALKPASRDADGFNRTIRHLCGTLCLSEAESQHLLGELTKAILIACELDGSVRIPRFGRFTFENNNFVFSPAIVARDFAKSAVNDKAQVYGVAEDYKIKRVVNHQDTVKDSLLDYLKNSYPTESDWETPLGKLYKFEEVKEALLKVKSLNDDYSDIFWVRILSSRRRDTVANNFLHSEATIKRRFDTVVCYILLLLIHPNLVTDQVRKLYRS
jgi:hypothetical protein